MEVYGWTKESFDCSYDASERENQPTKYQGVDSPAQGHNHSFFDAFQWWEVDFQKNRTPKWLSDSNTYEYLCEFEVIFKLAAGWETGNWVRLIFREEKKSHVRVTLNFPWTEDKLCCSWIIPWAGFLSSWAEVNVKWWVAASIGKH
jgi:hypothetical protein